jgi:hypothetical protein
MNDPLVRPNSVLSLEPVHKSILADLVAMSRFFLQSILGGGSLALAAAAVEI